MSDRPTPLTDAIRNTPLMGETVTEHKWDKMTEHARRLERDRAELIEALGALCDAKRPLDWSPTIKIAEAFAKARALLARMKEDK